MKKVAFLIDKMYGGGQERVVSNISLALPNDVKQYIILNDDKEGFLHKADIIKLKSRRAKTFIGRLIGYWRLKSEVKKIKKRHKFDAVISITNMYNIINSKTCVGEKNIVSIHMFRSSVDKGFRKLLYQKINKNMFAKAYKIVTVSKQGKEDMIKNYGISEDKIKVIYNFFDTENILKVSCDGVDKLFDDSKFNLLHVGRLNEAKGQWHLLRVLSMVLKRRDNVFLTLVGDGEDKKRLLKLIDKLGIKDNVRFINYTNRVYQYYRQADLFVLPSLNEAFPMVVGEALSCGTPVVASDCKSGPREYLEPKMNLESDLDDVLLGEFGILVPRFNLEHDIENVSLGNVKQEIMFARVLIKLVDDRELVEQYKKQALIRARDFDFNMLINEWLEII